MLARGLLSHAPVLQAPTNPELARIGCVPHLAEREGCANDAAAAPELGPVDPGAVADSLKGWYRWGWFPLVAGCGVISASVTLVSELAMKALELHPQDGSMRWPFFIHATVTSVLLASWAGLFVLRSRQRIHAVRDRLLAQQAMLSEQAWRAEEEVGLGALARVLAHEVRGPLHRMVLHCAMIRKTLAQHQDAAGGPLGEAARELEAETGRLDHLLNDYLDHGKSTGAMRLERVDLGGLIHQVTEAHGPLLEAKQVTVEVALPDQATLVMADRARVVQLVQNLVKNAVEVVPRGGHVLIRAYREGQQMLLTVQDDGPPMQDPTSAFRPFYATRADGSGLRLAIVRDVVRAHGGDVTASNTPEDRGAQITVRLPAERR